jgi:hypothetical protein
MWHTWNRREIYTKFWWETLKERDHLEDIDRDGRIILKCLEEKGG